MPQTRIYTTSAARTKHFVASSGNAYTTFSEALVFGDGEIVAGPRQFMIKTVELEEFLELVNATKAAWEKAKAVEQESN